MVVIMVISPEVTDMKTLSTPTCSCCSGMDKNKKYVTGIRKDGSEWIPAFIEYVDREKCTGCGKCVRVCSEGVYELQEIEGKRVAVPVNDGRCVGDGACHKVCKPGAMVCKPKTVE
ncbi:4Fe-4S dicluster domain-containing protein [Methanosarcina sp. KYL-1]|nr:4Fe-4S dicluster domain-containing protein [Methanosarcina sp. KYL-1]